MQKARLDQAAAGLRPANARRDIARDRKQIGDLAGRMQAAVKNILNRETEGLARYDRLLESYSYRNVLKRGFAVVRGVDEGLIGRASDLIAGQGYILEMQDGRADVTAGASSSSSGTPGPVSAQSVSAQSGSDDPASAPAATVAPKSAAKPKPARKKDPVPKDDDRQGSLL